MSVAARELCRWVSGGKNLCSMKISNDVGGGAADFYAYTLGFNLFVL